MHDIATAAIILKRPSFFRRMASSQQFSAVGESAPQLSSAGYAEVSSRMLSAPGLSAVGDKEKVNRVLAPWVKQMTKKRNDMKVWNMMWKVLETQRKKEKVARKR